MKNIAVVYRSKYGTTKQYAQWIAEECGAELFESRSVTPLELARFDAIAFGGGLYAGGMLGIRLTKKFLKIAEERTVIAFSVGASLGTPKDIETITRRNFTAEESARVQYFHLRGGLFYSKMGVIDRLGMSVLVAITRRTPEGQRDEEANALIATYGKDTSFLDRRTIAPIVEALKG